MTASEPVGVPDKATPVEPGEPIEDIAVSQLGGTFAERAKARSQASKKQVSKASGDVEDKAVKKASTKRAAKKS